MERFVAWLSGLSSLTIYAAVGLATLLENVFPPTPSDVVAALGGFLTRHAGVSPVAVWAVAWTANMSGAVGVYLLARRFGRGFLGSRLGQRLLPAEAILSMEREYLRFGLFGVFLARLLPGFRTFIAPFVGLVDLPPWRALIPMALASALWYAALIWAGMRVGENWEAINQFIGHLNLTLAVLAGVLAVIIGWWFWRRSKAAGPRRRRLLRLIRYAIGDRPAGGPPAEGDLATQGAAALLNELTSADPGLSLEERGAIAERLRAKWGLGEPRTSATGQHALSDTAELATIVAERYERPQRIALAERLYRLAMADGMLSLHEERLMRRAGDLLGLTPDDLAEARRRASGP